MEILLMGTGYHQLKRKFEHVNKQQLERKKKKTSDGLKTESSLFFEIEKFSFFF